MKIILLFVVILFASCVSNMPEDVRNALRQSRANRSELETVIRHFSEKDDDSLKLKAAYFLIANMPGHYSYTGDYLETFRTRVDSAYSSESPIVREVLYNAPLLLENVVVGLKRQYDIENIGSDFLIDHINYEIDAYRDNPLYSDLSFEDFCEYVLPYRLFYEKINDKFLSYQKRVRDSMATFLRSLPYTSYTTSDLVRKAGFGQTFNNQRLKAGYNLPDPDLRYYTFECNARAQYECLKLRSLGIPSFVDFCPAWSSRDGSHSWHNYLDIYGKVIRPDQASYSKVYRRTYAANPVPDSTQLCRNETIPFMFRNPFIRDVTDEYAEVYDVDMRNIAGIRAHYGYLCLHNKLVWQPVAWGEFDCDRIRFTKLAGGCLFLPVCCVEKEGMRAFDYPFSVTPRKVIRYIPDKDKLVTMKLERKYPNDLTKLYHFNRMVGTTLEASNTSDFIYADTLYTVKDIDYTVYPSVSLSTNRAYRYYRVKKADTYIRLAELHFKDENGKELMGKVIPDYPEYRDNDPLTVAVANDGIVIDFGNPVKVREMAYMPMNDANNVFPGDLYELLYWDMDGWQSCGKQIAKDYTVTYDSVPGNAVYILRNLSRGKEERVFTCTDQHIRFW